MCIGHLTRGRATLTVCHGRQPIRIVRGRCPAQVEEPGHFSPSHDHPVKQGAQHQEHSRQDHEGRGEQRSGEPRDKTGLQEGPDDWQAEKESENAEDECQRTIHEERALQEQQLGKDPQDSETVVVGAQFALCPFGAVTETDLHFDLWHPGVDRMNRQLGLNLEFSRQRGKRLHEST